MFVPAGVVVHDPLTLADPVLFQRPAVARLGPADRDTIGPRLDLTAGGHFMNNTHDIIDDRIDVVTRGLMGLTVTCARCHDHKYDPIPAADYYALYGIFDSTKFAFPGVEIFPFPKDYVALDASGSPIPGASAVIPPLEKTDGVILKTLVDKYGVLPPNLLLK